MPQIPIGPEPPPYEFPLKVLCFVLCILGAMAAAYFIWYITGVIYNWVHKRREESRPAYRVRAKVLDKRTTCLDLTMFGSCREPENIEEDDTFVLFLFHGQKVELVASDELYVKVLVGSDGWLDYRGDRAVDFTPVSAT